MANMNTSKIVVRLDAEHHAAEIEMMTPHHAPPFEAMEHTLRRIGLRPVSTVELSTPRFRVTRTKVVKWDGSKLDAARVMHILRAASAPRTSHSECCSRAA